MLTRNHEPEIFILKFGITTSKSQIVNLKSQIITQAHRLIYPDKNKILDHLPAMLQHGRKTFLFLRRPLSQHVIHLFSLGELVPDTKTQTSVILCSQQLVNTLQTVMSPVTSLASQSDRPER